jgi:hypothetical protein
MRALTGIMAQMAPGPDHSEAERRTFATTSFLACLAAMELEGVVLEEI